MEKKPSNENKTRRNDYKQPFLGLPTAVWTGNYLYIKFVNSIKPYS